MGINRTPFTLTEGRQFSKLEQQMIWKTSESSDKSRRTADRSRNQAKLARSRDEDFQCFIGRRCWLWKNAISQSSLL